MLEVTTSFQHFKCGIEIQIESVNQQHNKEYSLVRQQPYQYMKEDGLTLSHQNKNFSSTESNSVFEVLIHRCTIGLMFDGKFVWLQEEDPHEDISVALTIWGQSFTSELLKDILEAISLIPRYKTMC